MRSTNEVQSGKYLQLANLKLTFNIIVLRKAEWDLLMAKSSHLWNNDSLYTHDHFLPSASSQEDTVLHSGPTWNSCHIWLLQLWSLPFRLQRTWTFVPLIPTLSKILRGIIYLLTHLFTYQVISCTIKIGVLLCCPGWDLSHLSGYCSI